MKTVLSETLPDVKVDWLRVDNASSDVSTSFLPSQDNNFQMCSLMRNTVKCVVVGDSGVGKTSLLFTYCCGEFPSEYVPYVFDNYSMQVKVDELTWILTFWDTGLPGEYYHGLRPLSYPNTDVFLVCFSIAEPASFRRVKEYWFPEIKHHCPNTPFILLGTKVDLRGDRATLDMLTKKKEEVVSKEEGKRMAKSLKAAKYLECSALTREGVKNVFDEAIHQQSTCQRCGRKKLKKSEKKKCNVL